MKLRKRNLKFSTRMQMCVTQYVEGHIRFPHLSMLTWTLAVSALMRHDC